MTTQLITQAQIQTEWIKVEEGKRILYVYLHIDPAIHQRFSIERTIVKGRKAPYFSVCDTLSRIRGFHDRLSDAKKAVDERIGFERDNPDARTGVANDVARGDIAKALIRILDYVDERAEQVRNDADAELADLRRAIRHI